MYFDYSKEAQKCYCGTEKCRGWLGGAKSTPLKSQGKQPSTPRKKEKKKQDIFDDVFVSQFWFHVKNVWRVLESLYNESSGKSLHVNLCIITAGHQSYDPTSQPGSMITLLFGKEIKSPPDVLVVFLTASEVWARERRGLWPRLFQIRPHLLLKRPKWRLGET